MCLATGCLIELVALVVAGRRDRRERAAPPRAEQRGTDCRPATNGDDRLGGSRMICGPQEP
jgi:hypothetical protein